MAGEDAVDLVIDFDDAGKPIAAICHGPWLLVEADIVDGRTVTGWPSIHTDLAATFAGLIDGAGGFAEATAATPSAAAATPPRVKRRTKDICLPNPMFK